jgi:undecaprenyl-diphosphatase
LPVIFGATVLEAKELLAVPLLAERFLILFVGTIVAAISGYIAIKLVLGILQKKKFSWFAYYCFLVGILGILFIG